MLDFVAESGANGVKLVLCNVILAATTTYYVDLETFKCFRLS